MAGRSGGWAGREGYNDNKNNNNANGNEEDDENEEGIEDKDEALLTDWMASRTAEIAMTIFMVNEEAE